MGGTQKRGRQTDPKNVRLALRWKYGDESFARFADLIGAKKLTTRAGGERVKLPARGAVLRFCRGDKTDESTWGTLCDELGVPFSLLENGHKLSESDLDNAEFKRHWSFCRHPAAYSGQVWLQVVAKYQNRGVAHQYVIRWGPWRYTDVLNFGHLESVSLSHMKGSDGLAVPIIFDVSAPCYVTCGQGESPGELVHDINHGWTRVDGA
ncbi:MAG: hypothetical protein U0793_17195 [Gemmataceae bacterium]